MEEMRIEFLRESFMTYVNIVAGLSVDEREVMPSPRLYTPSGTCDIHLTKMLLRSLLSELQSALEEQILLRTLMRS